MELAELSVVMHSSLRKVSLLKGQGELSVLPFIKCASHLHLMQPIDEAILDADVSLLEDGFGRFCIAELIIPLSGDAEKV